MRTKFHLKWGIRFIGIIALGSQALNIVHILGSLINMIYLVMISHINDSNFVTIMVTPINLMITK